MIKINESKLMSEGQIKSINHIGIENILKNHVTYAISGMNKHINKRFSNNDKSYLESLANLFNKNANPSRFYHFIAHGKDVGTGLFTFSKHINNSDFNIYLTTREVGIPFIGIEQEYYLGVFKNSSNIENIFKTGVENYISLENSKFKLNGKFISIEGQLIMDLYCKLPESNQDHLYDFMQKQF